MAGNDHSLTSKDLTRKYNIGDFRNINKDLELWKLYVSRLNSEDTPIDDETNDMLQDMYHVIKETKLLAETLSVHLEHYQSPKMRTQRGRQNISHLEHYQSPKMRTQRGRENKSAKNDDSGLSSSCLYSRESALLESIGTSDETKRKSEPIEHKEDSDSQEENELSLKC